MRLILPDNAMSSFKQTVVVIMKMVVFDYPTIRQGIHREYLGAGIREILDPVVSERERVGICSTGNYSHNGLSGMALVHNSRGWHANGYSGHLDYNDDWGYEIRYDAYVEDVHANTTVGNGNGIERVDNGGSKYN